MLDEIIYKCQQNNCDLIYQKNSLFSKALVKLTFHVATCKTALKFILDKASNNLSAQRYVQDDRKYPCKKKKLERTQLSISLHKQKQDIEVSG